MTGRDGQEMDRRRRLPAEGQEAFFIYMREAGL